MIKKAIAVNIGTAMLSTSTVLAEPEKSGKQAEGIRHIGKRFSNWLRAM